MENTRTVALAEIEGHAVVSFENNSRIEARDGIVRLWHTHYGCPGENYSGTLYAVLHHHGRTVTISGASASDCEGAW